MKNLLKDRRFGFYLSAGSAAAAVIGAVVYVIVYMVTAGQTVDRVFDWMTFGFALGGGLVGLVCEIFRLRFGPILATCCLSVGLAIHLVESAYPLADVLTGVPFFGGNFTLALIFAVVFGLATLVQVAAAFMEHNK